MKAKSILPLVIVISALLAQVTFGALPRYEITDLGTLGGTYSRAFAINDAGQVVGVSQTIESGGHAFLWDRRNGMIDLGVLYEGDMSAAYGVNDHGQVVGFSGPDDRDAFIWDSENGMRCPEGFGSEARAINNAGQVVVNTEFHSYLWHPNEVAIVVGSLGTDRVSACALNSAGQVVGHAYTSINEYHAFLWDRATGMRDLGTLGGTRSMAFGINDTGQVVGKSRTTTGDWHEHAFLWNSDTGMIDLGEGRALAINNAEQVVGYMSSSGPAFYWDSDIGMIQLSDLLLPNSGWRELHYASDINKRGQVVGTGLTDNGKIHGFLMTPVPPRTYYVDDDANGANDGSSWANAFNYLQDALAAAWSGDEIRVAQGIYIPDSNSANTNGSGDREATFQLINGVTLKGGYAGVGESDPNDRDIELYETNLSGDLDGNDIEVNDPCDLLTEPTRADNSYHVVSSNNCDPNAVLDGVAITGGNANCCYEDDFGGGIYNESGRPTISNCTFAGNAAFWDGGGMCNSEGSPTLTNCTFIGNLAGWGGGGLSNWASSPAITNCTFSGNLSGGFGGGMVNHYSSPMVTNCTFSGNRANWSGGGGMCNFQGNPTVTNCTFSGNSADSGGGMRNYQSSPTVTNCTFSDNSTLGGGGMVNDSNSNPTVTNCTFINNTASYNGAGMTNSQSSPMVTNCKFIGNTAVYGGGMANYEGSSPTVTNCIFKGNLALDSPSVLGGWGGGILNFYCSPTFINSTFSGNSANYGGGIYNWCSSTLTVTNCTFTGNSAGFDGGGMVNDYNSTLMVTNCILWGNYAQNHGPQVAMGPFSEQCTVNVSYSDVQGGQAAVYDPCDVLVWDTGNIETDPCFVDPGYWNPNGTPDDTSDDFWVEGDYHLLADSPCIDAGDPNYIAGPNETDLDGKPRVMGGRIDMGAYESPVPAEARIVPRTINLTSKGKWITCYIWLPEDYNVADIDPNSVLLEDEIEAEQFSVDEQAQLATARFSREEVQAILEVGEIELTITGQLTDGTIFEGTDTIKVTNKAGGKSAK